MIFLDDSDFFDTALGASAFEAGRKPGVENLLRRGLIDEASAHRQDVGVVVGAREMRGERIVAGGGADARDLIGGDGHAQAGAAHQHAEIRLTGCNPFRDLFREIRVVDGLRADGPGIFHVVPPARQVVADFFLQCESGVVATDDDAKFFRQANILEKGFVPQSCGS